MRILVTGAAGFIGSVLVPTLLAVGHEVTALDTYKANDASLAMCCANPRFNPVRGDVRDERLVSELMAQCDAVMPLAALVGAPLCNADPWAAVSTNYDAIKMLLKYVGKDKRIIYPTTNSGYGIGTDAECTEDSPLNPLSLYGRLKVDAEKLVLDRGGVTLRLATVFGMSPHMRLDLLVNDFTYRAVTDRALVVFEGHFKRNYIHIRDVAGAFLHALDNYGAMGGKPYNVGLSSANLSKLELCAAIKEIVPEFVYLEAPIGEDPDKRNYVVSNARMEATGWAAHYTLQDGIREMVHGYRMIGKREWGNV